MKYLMYSGVYISILALSYRARLSWSMIAALGTGIMVVASELKLSLYEGIIVALILNTIPLVTYRFKREFQEFKLSMRRNLETVKASHDSILAQDTEQVELNLGMERKLNQVLSLYDVSKEMSGCLALEDILDVYASELKKSFRFKAARLALLRESGEIESIYQIATGKAVTKVAPDHFDHELVSVVRENPGQLVITQDNISPLGRRMELIKHFETLVAVPLLEERELTAVLSIENLSKIYIDHFMILAHQCAIQLKKVLLYRKVQEMAITDFLTEASNRRYFLERFSEEVRRSMRRKAPLSFLMLDLDYFKNINDTHGHLAGDVVLKEIASLLKSHVREIDMVGRYGGEEFGVVLSGTGRTEALQVAERLRSSIEKTVIKAYDVTIALTVSIGVAVFPEDGFDRDTIIESADRSLYKAKQAGRNRVC